MFNPIARYTHWLHTRWPAGKAERLPEVNEDYSTNVPGLFVTGDLTGVPLLKFSSDSGARVVRGFLEDPGFKGRETRDDVLDLVIIGAGVSGIAAAMEARKHDLRFEILESREPFFTIVNFPKEKPIYTYPTDMTPAGDLQFTERSDIREGLIEELRDYLEQNDIEAKRAQAEKVSRKGGVLEVHLEEGEPLRAHRVIVAIGRSGNFRTLDVPGEKLDKVSNRLHDPKDFCDKRVLVVGGGDSAMESAIALAQCGAEVTLSYRKAEFSRPKPENLEKVMQLAENPDTGENMEIETVEGDRVTTPSGDWMEPRGEHHRGRFVLAMPTEVKEITEDSVTLVSNGDEKTIENDHVFTMIGREPPLDFFRRSGVKVRGEYGWKAWTGLALILALCVWMYHWKKGGVYFGINETFAQRGWFPFRVPEWWASLGERFNDPSTLVGVLKISVGDPGFYYSLAYCSAVVGFGIARIRRRRTPYVTVQTVTLAAIQVIPLFLLPYILLPLMGNNGWFEAGFGKTFADWFFPEANYGHGREYWRAFGFILAWPLFIWNVFTSQPLVAWLILSVVQTFVIIPLIIYKWGKGAYCGWVCSCGALAETMGDAHRHKMPHGPLWNRVNMIGQVFLAFALAILAFRIVGWLWPEGWGGRAYNYLMSGMPVVNYVWFVDLLFAGILGVGLYFHFSGRVWCRFACPLAALMHIYTRFSRFRIISEKKKCISCNVCTAVCHQGIDVMSFANKGIPMEDPQCVRCSACVQSCPTGVLQFGEVNRKTGETIRKDRLPASRILMAEGEYDSDRKA